MSVTEQHKTGVTDMCQQTNEKKTAPFQSENPANHAMTGDRILVSFVIFAYNQERYIREALEGAFAQTHEPLEIIISDDCSTDTTFQIISELAARYNGPHKLIWRRNDTNLGFAEHISSVMRLVSGELIVAADGDDISYPERTKKVVEQWLNNHRESGSIFSLIDTINQQGHITTTRTNNVALTFRLEDRNPEIVRALSTGTLGCALAWTKDVFQIFGDLDRRSIHQDITIPLRAIMLGSVTFIQEELVLYRLSEDSLTRISHSSGRDRSSKMKKYWATRIANYEQFDRDILRALELRIVEVGDADWMRAIVYPERELARLNYLFFSGDFIVRLKAILWSSRKIPVGRKMKLILLAFFPWLYNFRAPKI